MAAYLYRCGQCGDWEIQRPIGTAEQESDCPSCGATGRRLYTAPLLNRTPQATVSARMREEASRDVPELVTSVPAAVGRPAPRDPRWSKLPRP
jgi:putative FmdB family regulatory protein